MVNPTVARVARLGFVTEGEAIHLDPATEQQKSAAGVVLAEVRKAQTVCASSRTLDSRVAWRQPISHS